MKRFLIVISKYIIFLQRYSGYKNKEIIIVVQMEFDYKVLKVTKVEQVKYTYILEQALTKDMGVVECLFGYGS